MGATGVGAQRDRGGERASITSSESFLARAQRSEAARVVLWAGVLLAMIVLTAARRWERGAVMSRDEMFYPYAGVLVLGLLVQVVLLAVLRRANRAGRLLPGWVWRASAALDLGVAAGLLVIAAFLSPRGPIPALTAPPLLLLTLVVLLSVLRLRPGFALFIGLSGAAVHAILAWRAVVVTGTTPDPVYFAYSVVLALSAVAAMFVARAMRAHVREGAEEAAAHERAERRVAAMRRDLEVAREIQQGLMPKGRPVLAGFDITGMNRPAEETAGDYYDWQPLPDGRLAVVLADVAGHGIGPALGMALCRAYARASAPLAPDPGALLTRLNDLLGDDLPSNRFITLVVAVLDSGGGARLLSAGHGPTLLFRAASGEVTRFGGDGMPLGVSPGEVYGPTTSLALERGDVLLMLTDGFFEWSRPDGEAFGIDRLEGALRASAGGGAVEILGMIDGEVRRFCEGTPQPDDMTAVVVKRTGG